MVLNPIQVAFSASKTKPRHYYYSASAVRESEEEEKKKKWWNATEHSDTLFTLPEGLLSILVARAEEAIFGVLHSLSLSRPMQIGVNHANEQRERVFWRGKEGVVFVRCLFVGWMHATNDSRVSKASIDPSQSD